MKTINITIRGIQPLLQHKMPLVEAAQLMDKVKKVQGQRNQDNPEDYLYKNEDNVICQPSEHIYQGIVKRLSNFKIQGRGKKTYKELGQGSIRVTPEFIPHKIQTWIPDIRTVVVPATRGRVVRIRPKFNEWELDFQVQILNDEMPSEVIKECLILTGKEGGLGDYRPRFGLFEVIKFETL